MLWLSGLAKVILFLESGHTGRERKRWVGWGGGGGVRDGTELTAGVNLAFSSMPNDMHAEERQARLKCELKCKWEESDKAHRSVPISCLDPLESKLGFSHLSIFSQSAERAARAAPNGVKKRATFLLVFRCLNHTASSRKAFNSDEGHTWLMHLCISCGRWWVHSALFRALSVLPTHLSANLVSPARPNEQRSRKTFGVCRTRICVCIDGPFRPALRSRSSERERKLSNGPAASSFFQTFRPVDLKSPTDLSDIPTDLTDLWADLWSLASHALPGTM